MELTVCRTCGEEFDPAEKRKEFGGYIDQCNHCSRVSGDTGRKYVGRPGATNKDASIVVFRKDLATIRAQLRREGACGFGPNIGVDHPVAVQAREDNKFGEDTE